MSPANALVIDTSSWVTILARGMPEGIRRALFAGRVYLPPVVAAELLSGRLGRRERTALEEHLAGLPVCGADLPHWFRVGALRSTLGARGLSVSTPDAHVAQCALDLDAELLTEDHVFGLVARHAPLRLSPAVGPR
jgi:predicted nucleic acid-binding protein